MSECGRHVQYLLMGDMFALNMVNSMRVTCSISLIKPINAYFRYAARGNQAQYKQIQGHVQICNATGASCVDLNALSCNVPDCMEKKRTLLHRDPGNEAVNAVIIKKLSIQGQTFWPERRCFIRCGLRVPPCVASQVNLGM